MSNWKLTLSYDGTSFHGWQVQPSLPTVQGCLADALEHVTGERTLPQGSGRTDAGVHALGQVVSVAFKAPIPAANLLRALNRVLPASVRVLAAEIVPAEFHARLSARGKTYEYRIFERQPPDRLSDGEPDQICPPFQAPFVWDCRWTLDLHSIQEAAGRFLGTHDFTSFAASDPDLSMREVEATPNPLKIMHSSNFRRENGLLIYRVNGSGFLHHMVRNMVGTLTDVGRGALQPEDISRILAARNRSAAGPTAPASGLFLIEVEYPRQVRA